MPLPDDCLWSLSYEDPRSSARFLVPVPPQMLRDFHMLARAREISLAELIRRTLTQEIALEIAARPEIHRSFKGRSRLSTCGTSECSRLGTDVSTT